MTLASYHGHETLSFPDYLDLGTGKTLHAEPGGVYDITPVSGRPVDEVPAPWFTAVDPEAWAEELAAREAARLAAESAAGGEAGSEPETQPAEG